MDKLVERYRHVIVKGTEPFDGIPGFEVIQTGGGKMELLVDLAKAQLQTLTMLGHEIVRETRLSLEELFLLLAAVPTGTHDSQAVRAVA